MKFPAELRYTASHEWVRLQGRVATVGITAHAQDSLGELVHVELPAVGDEVEAGKPCCEVESTKAVSDVYSPVSGVVVAVNDALDGAEDTVNKAPYGEGWLFAVELAEGADLSGLLDADAYAATLA